MILELKTSELEQVCGGTRLDGPSKRWTENTKAIQDFYKDIQKENQKDFEKAMLQSMGIVIN